MPNHTRRHNLDTRHPHRHDHANSNPPPPPKPSPKLLSIFLKFIVMSLILSLFLLFLGLAAILLLLAGSFLHRRRQRHLLRSAPPRTSSFSVLDIQNHLPPFQYPAAKKSPDASDDCSICLEYFNEGEICRVLPVCDHVFHARCVDTWLTKVPNCPICRTRVRLDAGGSSDSMISDDETKFLWAIGVGR